MEERRIGAEQIQIILVPGIVCAVFSIELGLKALILEAGGKPHGHDLELLFDRLAPAVQARIIMRLGIGKLAFATNLKAMARSFEEWRYIYEQRNAEIDLGFLHNLAQAVIGELGP